MTCKNYIKTGIFTLIAVSASLSPLHAKQMMVGKLSPAEFKQLNSEAAAKVSGLKPDGKPFSTSDAMLLKEIAAGGMMQLEVSKTAFKMTSSDEVKAIAQAEIEEQTLLASKLKEIASSGGVMLPESASKETMAMVEMLNSKSGAELDMIYLKESGVKGHEKLKMTMDKVESSAENQVLKSLAMTTLPLIKAHLQVAKDESSSLK